MKKLMVLLAFVSLASNAQVNQSEQEKIQSQRDQNRKEDALLNETYKANEKNNPKKIESLNLDPSSQLEVDHSTFGYTILSDSKNPLSGIKFSGAFCAQFLQEQKIDKRYLIAGGVELPVDLDLPMRRILPFAGGGIQFGINSGVYISGGLDFRIINWFKIQWGLHYALGTKIQNQVALGFTW